jgi:ADP-heptose:LPS heptosyltransferase
MSKNKLLIFFLKFFFYYFINLFYFKKKVVNKDGIVIIKLDGIGDYILFRNFISEIRKKNEYQNTNITLVGNYNFRKLSQKLDKGIVNNFIWVNKNKFLRDIFYRINILIKLNTYSYSVLLHPTFSRDFFVSDWISNFIKAKIKITFFGDLANQYDYEKKISDNYYNYLIKFNLSSRFDFFKYKYFFEFFLKKKIKIKKTFINKNYINTPINLKNYISFFVASPGWAADNKKKIYSLNNYISLAKLIERKYSCKIIFLGGKENILDQNLIPSNYINLIGKTDLVQLLEIIRKSKLLISGDTCAHHMAAAVNTNCVVIGSGPFPGRFIPYPKSFDIKHKSIFNKNKNSNYFFDVNNIKVTKVMKIIEKNLSK